MVKAKAAFVYDHHMVPLLQSIRLSEGLRASGVTDGAQISMDESYPALASYSAAVKIFSGVLTLIGLTWHPDTGQG